MASLQIDFLGMQFPNPFMLASAPPTRNGWMIQRAFQSGWGGAVTKTISLHPSPDVHPRLHPLQHNHRNIGMENIELISRMTVAEWQKDLAAIKSTFPQRPLWASIMAGTNREDWQRLVSMLEETGIDAFEINVSCPHGMPGKGMGAYIGQHPELTGQVVSWVKQAASIPVIVKLTPNVTDIGLIASVAKENGTDAIAAINTVSGIVGVDLNTLHPLPSVNGLTSYGGYSGPGIKPIALRCIAQIAKATGLPISGLGGISNWMDAGEFLAMGSGTVQVGTAVMWKGYHLIEELSAGLIDFLDQKGYADISSFIGVALDNVVEFSHMQVTWQVVASVDETCNGCLLCVTACTDGGFQAIQCLAGEGEIVTIDVDRCDGCGLCAMICPEKSIKMVPRNEIVKVSRKNATK